MWELWGVEISAFPLTWHIAYTIAAGWYRTSRDYRSALDRLRVRMNIILFRWNVDFHHIHKTQQEIWANDHETRESL